MHAASDSWPLPSMITLLALAPHKIAGNCQFSTQTPTDRFVSPGPGFPTAFSTPTDINNLAFRRVAWCRHTLPLPVPNAQLTESIDVKIFDYRQLPVQAQSTTPVLPTVAANGLAFAISNASIQASRWSMCHRSKALHPVVPVRSSLILADRSLYRITTRVPTTSSSIRRHATQTPFQTRTPFGSPNPTSPMSPSTNHPFKTYPQS